MISNHDECLEAVNASADAYRKLRAADPNNSDLIENLNHFLETNWQQIKSYLLSDACEEERSYCPDICNAYQRLIDKLAAQD